MSKVKIKKIVQNILNEKPILVDRFDASYLADFHHILRENFGIESLKDQKVSELVRLTKLKKPILPQSLL